MAYDEAIAERVRRALARREEIVEQKMFGGLAFLCRGRICCCVGKGEILLRLGDAGAERAMSAPGTRPVAFSGRPINSMVWLGPVAFETDAQLRAWLKRSLAFLDAQPAKKARRKPAPRPRVKRPPAR
ncbi:TfoX family protein [bacterium]|nr:MAG: TfoX family protein [bacterium]